MSTIIRNQGLPFRAMGLAFISAMVLFAAPVRAAQPGPRLSKSARPSYTEPELYITDEFIVVLSLEARARIQTTSDANNRTKVNLPTLQARMDAAGVKSFEREFPTAKSYPPGHKFPDLTGHYIAHVEDGTNLQAAMDAMAADPNVEHVEKIGVHYASNTPNDSFWASLWNMKPPNGINGPPAWKIEHGSPDVIIAIADTGVRYFHKDLGGNVAPWSPAAPQNVGNIFINPGEIPNNGIDDDGNGRIDDVVGYDFLATSAATGCTCIDSDCNTVDNDPDDFNGHGTHVSGIAAALTNNARGVAGVAGGFGTGSTTSPGNGAKILPLRVGWQANCTGVGQTGLINMAAVAQAMNYVATMVDDGYDITAINCSWGSSNTGGVAAALAAVLARDVMVVKAAGNGNSSVPDFFETQAGVVSVAGTASNGTGYTASNFGPWVALAAPAVGILSTVRNSSDPNPNNDYYASFDGTSMAAPHVCGVAALLESCRPDLSASDKLEVMQQTSIAYSDVRDLGDGIVNANNAVQAVCLEDLKFNQSLSGSGEDMASNIDTSDLSPNIVKADDFVSDGRPITSLQWWGSETPAFPIFKVDDGAAEDSIGVNNNGSPPGNTFGWANRFTNTTDGPVTITTIQVAFGSAGGSNGVNVGDAVDAVIWLDAAATANMANATPVIRWSLPGGVHANDGATFATHTVPAGGVVVPAGADFYVGCGDIQTQNDTVVRYPASIDETAPSAVRSWAFIPNDNTFNENLAGQTIGTIDSFGLPGNWLIRAGGDPAPTPDGWFVSFHEPLSASASPPAQALGLYFCDQSVVTKKAKNVASCDGHQTYQYRADLADCCLLHAQADSRSGLTPAHAAEFDEQQCFTYGLDIQAVIGSTFAGPGCAASSTGRSATGNFWGWHSTNTAIGTSFGLQPAFDSSTTQSGSDWLFGPWTAATAACSTPNLAFGLLTTTLGTPDSDGNGIPDACEAPPSVVADPTGIDKTRFVSFSVPAAASQTAAGNPTALRIRLVSLHHVNPPYNSGPSIPFTSFEGQDRWVGPPAQYVESMANPVPFYAASLQCTPYYQDWSTMSLLHVTGSAITPSSVYDVSNVGNSCQGSEATCAAISAPLQIKTTRWGDVEIPYNPPDPTTQPDLADVGSLVNKFRSAPGAPIKARALLAGDDAFGNISINTISLDFNFGHIAACVDAFRGKPYPFAIETCP